MLCVEQPKHDPSRGQRGEEGPDPGRPTASRRSYGAHGCEEPGSAGNARNAVEVGTKRVCLVRQAGNVLHMCITARLGPNRKVDVVIAGEITLINDQSSTLGHT